MAVSPAVRPRTLGVEADLLIAGRDAAPLEGLRCRAVSIGLGSRGMTSDWEGCEVKDAMCVGDEDIIELGAMVVGDCMIRSEPAAMLFSIFQAGAVSRVQPSNRRLLSELRLFRCLSLHPAADVG